jgi:hypothetical protein
MSPAGMGLQDTTGGVLVGSFTCPLAPFPAGHGLPTAGGTSSSVALVAPGQDLQAVVMPLADRPWDPMSYECARAVIDSIIDHRYAGRRIA